MMRLFIVFIFFVHLVSLQGEEIETKIDNQVMYRNLSIAAAPVVIFLYGLSNWEWGKNPFQPRDEKWFQHDTYAGGVDKLGHMATHNIMTQGYFAWFRRIGLSEKESIKWSIFGTALIGISIEIGDAFSHYGFSYGDLIADSMGILMGTLYNAYPQLSKIVDYKIQYQVNRRHLFDPLNDYDHMKFAFSFHWSAWPGVGEHYLLRYLSSDIGYYSRDYEYQGTEDRNKYRHLFVGLSLNLSHLIDSIGDEGKISRYSSTFFHYIEPSFTAQELSHHHF